MMEWTIQSFDKCARRRTERTSDPLDVLNSPHSEEEDREREREWKRVNFRCQIGL